jgi:3-methyl-2-oxobutanoate hydroxymethyltransferase
MLSLAGVPGNLARFLTEQLTIPTIGIGSGPYCDGQVMVIQDLVGFVEGPPRPVIKSYSNFREQMEIAVGRFRSEVEDGDFPGPSHWHEMDSKQFEKFLSLT